MTTLATPATTEDLVARWWDAPDLTPAQEDVASQKLEDAWNMLLDRRPSLSDNMIAGTVRTETVIRVLCDMVLRVVRNPEGFIRESVDDWTGERAGSTADGALYVTASELADVTPNRASRKSVRLVAYGDS